MSRKYLNLELIAALIFGILFTLVAVFVLNDLAQTDVFLRGVLK